MLFLIPSGNKRYPLQHRSYRNVSTYVNEPFYQNPYISPNINKEIQPYNPKRKLLSDMIDCISWLYNW